MARPLDTEILARARALVANPKTWTKGATARDKRGRKVEPEDDAAVRFCLYGAVIRAASDVAAPVELFNRVQTRLTDASLAIGKGGAISIVNDTEGREAALTIIDAALKE